MIHLPRPPTPQDIIEKEPDLNCDIYNELSWIVNPTAPICDNGRVQLSESKTAIIIQMCQDIQALLPNAQPSLDQVLLSLTMHRKTGSSTVINTLHRMGYGISYTIFIEDKWADWSEKQHSYIPTNIKIGVHCTHVADYIYWRNKCMADNRETHNTNSILIQHKDTLVSDETSRGTQSAGICCTRLCF